MRRFLGLSLLFTVIMAVLASCTAQKIPANTVAATKTTAAPQIDGVVESAWNKAQVLKIPVSGGANSGTTTVEIRALYTSDSVYFLMQWADPTESFRRSPWQKQTDGTWLQLKDPNDKGSDNNIYYEDKMSFIWNINDSITGFNEQGCMVTCHMGEGKPFGNKYTANAGELGDIWHWKSVRNGPVAQIDDQYLDNTRYDAQKAPGAGRKSDPNTGGGYVDNKTTDGKLPLWALPNNKTAPPYWILDSEKVALDSSKYSTGAEVPSIIVAPFKGDRGDLTGKGVWKDGKWTLEWGRKLQTGSQYDVQFSSLDKTYSFGVATFDNAQVRHAFSASVYKLIFLK